MSDKLAVKLLLGAHDPARTMHTVAPPTVEQILAAAGNGHPVRSHRRLLLAGLALAVAAGALAAGIVVARDPGPAPIQASATVNDHPLAFWPVVRPLAFAPGADLVPGAGQPLAATAADRAQGRYTHITTVSWTVSFDDTPGADSRFVAPQRKDIWFDADGGRIATTDLPYVYLNDASRRHWESRHARAALTGTPAPAVVDLGPGQVGSAQTLPATDPAMDGALGLGTATTLTGTGANASFRAVVDLYSVHLVPADVRARLLARLARTPGVDRAGRTTDRAGRPGIGLTARNGDLTEILVFDPATGELLGWDELDRATGVVQASMLLLGADRTDHL